ncbi:cysteine hydrolase family protein [Deinococcus sedimenti]|uniref:Cysteine hydrolase n=1 Tax=Deinococcus sedimenti TaxID=1867090 RepID=A0ABQ2S3T5_9DEIO|nr:cysteine hydrolase family protein [Deinococcus sedimenti]GGR95046.1 cysteine hydrolase [Deinococcus sedimenti]
MSTPPTLLLIDLQQGFTDPRWGPRNNPHAEANAARLLGAWRDRGWPVIHVQHVSQDANSPLRPGQTGVDFMPATAPRPGEATVQKHVNSAFIGTDLHARLQALRVQDLVIAGLTTDHCVSTTTRMAGNLGYRVQLVGDATGTFDRVGPDGTHHPAAQLHAAHLASLHGEFATVVTTAGLLDDLPAPA